MPSKTSKTKQKHSWRFEAIGTAWAIETADEIPDDVREKVSRRIADFDAVYSRFRVDSTMAKMNEQAGEYEFPAEAAGLMELYRQLYDMTDGAMTPLVGRSLEAAGYDKKYSLSPTGAKSAPKWEDVMSWDGPRVTIHQPCLLDIGAAGKGLLIDEVAAVLEESRIDTYVIDASGDIRHRGDDDEIVGLENPYDATKVIGAVKLRNSSLCASATNRRQWADHWHHVLDGKTGKPVKEVVATWVMAESTMVADGLATALFFVDAGQLRDITDFGYVRLLANGKIEKSENFVGELYI